jgi:hypothetical protein
MASEWYLKVSGAWKQVNEAFYKQSGSWKEIQEAWIKVSGSWKQFYTAFVATAFSTATSNTSITVPTGANAIHVRAAVGGGAGGVMGAQYDKAGGESGGTGGGSGGYISDQVYSVTEGETLTLTVGAAGAKGTGDGYNVTAGNGGNTLVSGSTTGTIFTLTGGVGGSGTGGGVQGPLRTNNPSAGGTATINASVITSGTFRESNGATVTFITAVTLDDGPVGSYNNAGNGVAGVTGTNCGGDNCHVNGGTGAASYNGNIAGGTPGSPDSTDGGNGSRGSGGGGGGAENVTQGGNGGTGEIQYRFLRVN